jgi:hypothetical protein
MHMTGRAGLGIKISAGKRIGIRPMTYKHRDILPERVSAVVQSYRLQFAPVI